MPAFRVPPQRRVIGWKHHYRFRVEGLEVRALRGEFAGYPPALHACDPMREEDDEVRTPPKVGNLDLVSFRRKELQRRSCLAVLVEANSRHYFPPGRCREEEKDCSATC